MNLIKSVFSYRCPRCRQSKMFKEPFEIMKPLKMHDNCPVCNQSFEPEPGFYFGAMFISYGIGVLIFLAPALVLTLAFDWSVNSALILMLIVAGISFFKIARISRSVWIHIVVKYDEKYIAEEK